VKFVTRKIIAPLILKSGFSELLAHFTKNTNLILNYHGVVKKQDVRISKNHLSTHDFEVHLSYLKKKYNVLPLEEIRKTKNKSKIIGVTFDDGYLNNLTNALPLLEAFEIPATIFVTTQSFSKPELPLWYDLLDITNSSISWENLKNIIDKTALNSGSQNNFETYSSFKNYVKSTDPQFKSELLNTLLNIPQINAILNNVDHEYWKLMNPSEISIASQSKYLSIGSHGLSHSNLDVIDKNQLVNELSVSKNLLSEKSKTVIDSIAFPDGAYNDDVKKECRKVGYKRMYAVNYRTPSDYKESDIFNRFSISNTTSPESILIQINLAFQNHGF
jgi:peptidoglycan/xylan/chitin deacetylase (PgdA/CDA1 family)